MLSRAPLLWTMCPAALKYAFLLREGFDVVMYPKTLDPTSPSTRVLALLHVLWPQSPPHHLGGLWYCHSALNSASLLMRAPALTRVYWLQIAPRLEKGSDVDTCPMTLRGPWELRKNLPRYARALSMPPRRADRRCYHDLQTVHTCATVLRRTADYSRVLRC
jgi:hypothetical protein